MPRALLRRLVEPRSLLVIAGAIAVLTALLLVVAIVQLVAVTEDQSDDLREQRVASDCRSELFAEVNDIKNQADASLYRLVVASVNDDDEAILRHAKALNDQLDDLDEASARYTEVVEICNNG